jgi:hypothetical protein
MMPGHKRSGFRGVEIAICVVAMLVRPYASELQFVQISGKNFLASSLMVPNNKSESAGAEVITRNETNGF